jgi:hypothetical protein
MVPRAARPSRSTRPCIPLFLFSRVRKFIGLYASSSFERHRYRTARSYQVVAIPISLVPGPRSTLIWTCHVVPFVVRSPSIDTQRYILVFHLHRPTRWLLVRRRYRTIVLQLARPVRARCFRSSYSVDYLIQSHTRSILALSRYQYELYISGSARHVVTRLSTVSLASITQRST